MCRFVVYHGSPITLSDVLLNTENSLIAQSKHATKRKKVVNGDGFGVGWYPEHDDHEPAVLVGVEPAWSSRNLSALADKTRSAHFFAHIRDATLGMPISHSNCHPFHYGALMWMHNGKVNDFKSIKRSLLTMLSDEAFHLIGGTTDSEHLFALFVHHLAAYPDHSLESLQNALRDMIASLKGLLADAGVDAASFLNIAVSAGHGCIVTRYTTDVGECQPASLFYGQGRLDVNGDDDFKILPQDCAQDMVVIASEPLTCFRDEWIKVDRNMMLVVDSANGVSISALSR